MSLQKQEKASNHSQPARRASKWEEVPSDPQGPNLPPPHRLSRASQGALRETRGRRSSDRTPQGGPRRRPLGRGGPRRRPRGKGYPQPTRRRERGELHRAGRTRREGAVATHRPQMLGAPLPNTSVLPKLHVHTYKPEIAHKFHNCKENRNPGRTLAHRLHFCATSAGHRLPGSRSARGPGAGCKMPGFQPPGPERRTLLPSHLS